MSNVNIFDAKSNLSDLVARAMAGEVTPGFTKDAILRPEKEDPRGPSGVLTRVGGVLGALVSK